jgi:hypothetical protein
LTADEWRWQPIDARIWLIERKDDRYFLQPVLVVDKVRDTPPAQK